MARCSRGSIQMYVDGQLLFPYRWSKTARPSVPWSKIMRIRSALVCLLTIFHWLTKERPSRSRAGAVGLETTTQYLRLTPSKWTLQETALVSGWPRVGVAGRGCY